MPGEVESVTRKFSRSLRVTCRCDFPFVSSKTTLPAHVLLSLLQIYREKRAATGMAQPIPSRAHFRHHAHPCHLIPWKTPNGVYGLWITENEKPVVYGSQDNFGYIPAVYLRLYRTRFSLLLGGFGRQIARTREFEATTFGNAIGPR